MFFKHFNVISCYSTYSIYSYWLTVYHNISNIANYKFGSYWCEFRIREDKNDEIDTVALHTDHGRNANYGNSIANASIQSVLVQKKLVKSDTTKQKKIDGVFAIKLPRYDTMEMASKVVWLESGMIDIWVVKIGCYLFEIYHSPNV